MFTNSSLFELESPTHNRNRACLFALYISYVLHLLCYMLFVFWLIRYHTFDTQTATAYRIYRLHCYFQTTNEIKKKSRSEELKLFSFFINTLESWIWCNVFLFWWNLSAKNYCQPVGGNKCMLALHYIKWTSPVMKWTLHHFRTFTFYVLWALCELNDVVLGECDVCTCAIRRCKC